jgi:hypothetical protein
VEGGDFAVDGGGQHYKGYGWRDVYIRHALGQVYLFCTTMAYGRDRVSPMSVYLSGCYLPFGDGKTSLRIVLLFVFK